MLAFSAWWTWALLTLLLVGYALKALDEERFLGLILLPRMRITAAASRTACCRVFGDPLSAGGDLDHERNRRVI